jgi:(hydroxyamino)benzene mutase
MNKLPTEQTRSRQLIRLGVLLFFLGLIVGLIVPMLANPRMGLSSHLEGVMNGTFLVMLGLIWPRLRLSRLSLTITFWLAMYGTYINWATTLAAAALGAGQSMMPIAAAGHKGTPLQETIINFSLSSLALAMLMTCVIVLWGLRGTDEPISTEST